MKFSSRVPCNRGKSVPLINYLVERFTYFSHDQWYDRICDGRISVDNILATPDTTVDSGQTIIYDAGEINEPFADCRYHIIYEDEWLMAINKPGNLLIHRAGRSFKNNLMYQLRHVHTPPYPEAHSIHRLDRNTSGIVLVAKSASIQAIMSTQFINHTIQKKYIAYVEGIPTRDIDTICKPIGKDSNVSGGVRFRIDTEGKEAVTRIERCEPIGISFSELTLCPVTGRTHQLRVHCASIGHPIFGDTTYGSLYTIPEEISISGNDRNPQALHSRHALHCNQILFFHPWLEKECLIETSIPEDLLHLKKKLLAGDIK